MNVVKFGELPLERPMGEAFKMTCEGKYIILKSKKQLNLYKIYDNRTDFLL